ncbi:MAG: HAD family hydrolase [Aquabacterium sp.]|nr:MAG: HAD family hydrolase [Aquabacterium sp.]
MTTARFAARAILFDLDGTLADTAPDLGGALNDLRARKGLAPMDLALLRPWASAGARGLLGAGLQMQPGHPEYEAHRVAFLEIYESRLDRDSRLFDGIAALLAGIEARGLRWGIVTNKIMRFTAPVVAGLGLQERAAVVIAGDTTPHAKPHPAPLLEACKRLGITPAEAVYLGDDLRDVEAAHAAGMPAVAVEWGYLGQAELQTWGADAQIREPEDMLALLRPGS